MPDIFPVGTNHPDPRPKDAPPPITPDPAANGVTWYTLQDGSMIPGEGTYVDIVAQNIESVIICANNIDAIIAAPSAASAASASAAAAAASATQAANSATAANGSASLAAGSATAAQNSATTASTAALNANTSASAANTSAANAASSATAAANSATAASTSATNADTSWHSFNSMWYGPYSTAPAQDPFGAAPTPGDVYFNTTTNNPMVRGNSAWQSVVSGVTSVNGKTGAVTLVSGDISDWSTALAPYATLGSPVFTGNPTAPTPAPGDNDTSVATTAFVQAALTGSVAGVTAFNTRTGAVTLTGADVTSAGGALLASPGFTGNPTAPTPAPGDADTSVATTAFVTNAVTSAVNASVTAFNTRTGAVTLTSADVTGVGGALLASPTFTGDPKAPTPVPGDNDTSIATTAFVVTGFAPVNSPVFTGDPQAPQPAAGDADASIATTAFVTNAVATSLHDVGRNYLHNSMFNIAQRGAGPFTGAGIATLDRWLIVVSTDTASFTQVAMNDGDRTQIGDEAADYRIGNVFTGNAGAGSYNFLQQGIENVRRLAGKTVTVSFWANTSSGALKLGINIQQYFGTGGSPSATVIAQATGASVTLSTTWTRYSVTIALPSISGKTLGTNADHKSSLQFWYSSGATNNATAGNIGVQSGTVNLWGVQLELGPTATPLEKLDPVTQLQQCQRFYQTLYFQYYGYNAAAAASLYSMTLPVTMRATAASVVITSPTSVNCGAITGSAATSAVALVYATVTALGSFQISGSINISADL